jgi:lauroyl/myristoyl acyltransferase
LMQKKPDYWLWSHKRWKHKRQKDLPVYHLNIMEL